MSASGTGLLTRCPFCKWDAEVKECGDLRVCAACSVTRVPRLTDEYLKEAIDVINDVLGLDGQITIRGDEFKCVTLDDERSTAKTYLDAADAWSLAVAFRRLGDALQASKEAPGGAK